MHSIWFVIKHAVYMRAIAKDHNDDECQYNTLVVIVLFSQNVNHCNCFQFCSSSSKYMAHIWYSISYTISKRMNVVLLYLSPYLSHAHL